MQVEVQQISEQGFAVVQAAISQAAVDQLTSEIDRSLASEELSGTALRSSDGTVYAARNVLDLLPSAAQAWLTPRLEQLLLSVLGPEFGLVRGLFFDKPPQRSWSLPWHRDQTIAVAEHVRPLGRFSKPTLKAGVAHVIAPDSLLREMLTLRIHLDPVTDENGPLQVIPGSHRLDDSGGERFPAQPAVAIHAQRGDTLVRHPVLIFG